MGCLSDNSTPRSNRISHPVCNYDLGPTTTGTLPQRHIITCLQRVTSPSARIPTVIYFPFIVSSLLTALPRMSSLKKDNQSDVERITPPPGGLVLEEDANAGVKTVEAAEKVYGPHSKWFLFIGYVASFILPTCPFASCFLRVTSFVDHLAQYSLALASYVYSLDGSTTYTYLSFAASSFGEHSLISSIQVAQSIIS